MNRMYSFLRLQSKRKRTHKYVVVIAVLSTMYLILKHFTSKSPVGGHPQGIQLDFDLKNTPYRSLNNSHCIIQDDGQWDCPDIRTKGQNKIRQVQLVATRMLLIFDALCKKYGLRYWIKRGTLLGAVRHGGFIPWDSDLDIEMPIEDYLDFLRRAVKELPAGVLMQHHKNENKALHRLFKQSAINAPTLEQLHFSGIFPWNPRLRDENSCYKYCLRMNCSWADGILIDLYPVILRNGHFIDHHFEVFERPSFLKKLWRFVFGYDGYKAFPLRYMKFEGFEVPVQNDWEHFLTTIYGEMHMDLPPVETRVLPEESYSIPDALHACSELELDRPSGNVRVKRKAVLQKT